jgi:hypothetical protein
MLLMPVIAESYHLGREFVFHIPVRLINSPKRAAVVFPPSHKED